MFRLFGLIGLIGLIGESISTPIKNIITTTAFASSLVNNINHEIISNNLLFKDISLHEFHFESDIIYGGIISSMVLVQYKILSPKEKKFQNIDLFNDVKRKSNIILIPILIILFRNIDNAI